MAQPSRPIDVTEDGPDEGPMIRALAWVGPVSIVTVAFGWILAGFLPPPDPILSTGEVVALWQENTTFKIAGLVLCVWGGVLYIPFSIAISLALWREDRPLSITQGALATFGTVFFSLNFLLIAMVGFDPDRPPEATHLLHDIGFIMTFSPVGPFTFQYFAIGAAILRAKDSFFPRWVAYFNLWVGLLLVPASLIPFFKTGPFAWNGLLAFWVPVAVFTLWYFVMFWGLRRPRGE